MFDGDGLENRLVGFVVDAFALDGEVEESFGAEVYLIPEVGDYHTATARPIETFEHGVVEPFEWNYPDAGAPKTSGMNFMMAMMTSESINISKILAM